MVSNPMISFCIPTNGIIEWVIPVLDRLYETEVDCSLWEVVVTDNGHDYEFQKVMENYQFGKENFTYKKTSVFLFQNQIEALRLAKGEYLKFLNHRSILEKDAVEWFVDIIRQNLVDKPVMFFSNGALELKEEEKSFMNFDQFVAGMREIASWTTGVGVWKSDFNEIPIDWSYNNISPHSDVLFWVKENRKYKIFDRVWSRDIDLSQKKKGQYDLYKAFCVEEPLITLNLYIDGYISKNTLKGVFRSYEKRIAEFYSLFNIIREEASYDTTNFDEYADIFLSKKRIKLMAYIYSIKLFVRKMLLK